MLKVIRAEYDSVEAAEFAGRRIKLGVEGVRKAEIPYIPKTNLSPSAFSAYTSASAYTSFIPFSITSMNYSPQSIMLIEDESESEKAPPPQRTHLQITCESDSLSRVEQLLIATGGQSIKKLS